MASIEFIYYRVSFLKLIWINVNPKMDKWLQAL